MAEANANDLQLLLMELRAAKGRAAQDFDALIARVEASLPQVSNAGRYRPRSQKEWRSFMQQGDKKAAR
jgi:hypothetical protein